MPPDQTPAVDPIKAQDAKTLATKTVPSKPDADAIAIDHHSQLFIDDHLIRQLSGLHRRLNRPRKRDQAVLMPDRPWEGNGVVYGSVIEEDGAYRFYYKGSFNGPGYPNQADFTRLHGHGKYAICLAAGTDPSHFEKTPVQGSPFPGSNIVIDDQVDDFCLLRDDRDPDPQARYKLLSSRGNWWAGLTPATSPDGLRWTWGTNNAVTFLGDRCSYWFDPVRNRHVAWSRNYQISKMRLIVQKDTPDFNDWSHPRESHPHLVIEPDRYDHEKTQIYGGYAFWYQSLYIAYLEMYHIHHQRVDTQLACSRDGLTWTRLCDRDTFLPNGPHGEFDSYWIVPTFNPPIRRDGKLHIHFNGRPDPHSQPGFSHIAPGMGGAFGVAELREDGFVSLDATGSDGTLLTKLLKLPANTAGFELNACPFNARPGYAPMNIQLEIFSANDELIASRSIQVANDDRGTWHSLAADVRLPEVVYLKFTVRNARLYSFRAVVGA